MSSEADDGLVTIIAGSRSIDDYDTVVRAIEEAEFSISQVVSGGAPGVDKLGERWAYENSIPLRPFDVEDRHREEYGKKRAYIERNRAMAEYSEALIAVYDGESSGTQNMLDEARRRGLRRSVVRTDSASLGDFS